MEGARVMKKMMIMRVMKTSKWSKGETMNDCEFGDRTEVEKAVAKGNAETGLGLCNQWPLVFLRCVKAW